jgi:hypothetical protein
MSCLGNVCTRTPRLVGSILLLIAALVVPLAPKPVLAQDALSHRSYITPFPNGDRYRVVVLGDKQAEGLWNGLYRDFEADPTVDVLNQSKKWTGFTDPKRFFSKLARRNGAMLTATASRHLSVDCGTRDWVSIGSVCR